MANLAIEVILDATIAEGAGNGNADCWISDGGTARDDDFFERESTSGIIVA